MKKLRQWRVYDLRINDLKTEGLNYRVKKLLNGIFDLLFSFLLTNFDVQIWCKCYLVSLFVLVSICRDSTNDPHDSILANLWPWLDRPSLYCTHILVKNQTLNWERKSVFGWNFICFYVNPTSFVSHIYVSHLCD